mmetsp:Transcript_60631/g.107667  ORF Transcript_60631/g.107667 Transcript_60631/m.107667 type:complete len:91 (-) Transcript_60631:651-923(-)
MYEVYRRIDSIASPTTTSGGTSSASDAADEARREPPGVRGGDSAAEGDQARLRLPPCLGLLEGEQLGWRRAPVFEVTAAGAVLGRAAPSS